jgi:glycosyltransferase involved in cell wall biosynthesis
MAAGLPVVHVTSSESSVRELVRDGQEGLEVEACSASLAAALSSLIGDPLRRQELARGASRRAEQYQWSAVARRLEAILVDVCREVKRCQVQERR